MNAVANLIQIPQDVGLPQHYNDIQVKAAPSNGRALDYNPLVEKMEYFINGFPYEVKVVFRNGMSVIIPANLQSMALTERRFMVRTVLMYRGGVKPDLQQLSGVTGELTDGERAELIKAMDFSAGILDNGFKRIVVDYAMVDDQLTNSANGLYIPELDIVVTRYTNRPTYHPASKEGLIMASKIEMVNEKLTYDLEIVDPDNEYGVRFCNIANAVYRIDPNKRMDKRPGVYLRTVSKDIIKAEHYPFNKADEALQLFRTRDEAMAYGDIAAERDREFDKLKHEHAIFKQQLEMRNLEAKDRYDRRSLEQKDHYESRSYQRKDSSEAMKWVPTVVTAAAVCVGLVAKTMLASVTSGLSFFLPF